MAPFDPYLSLFGGALIGVAAVFLMLFTGRIAGISGILGSCLAAPTGDRSWRAAFIAGLVLAPVVAALAGYSAPAAAMPASWALLVIAGLLVGFGARLGGGCTSGHGVCGMARLSKRSIAATCIFMASAFMVVAVMRHVWGG